MGFGIRIIRTLHVAEFQDMCLLIVRQNLDLFVKIWWMTRQNFEFGAFLCECPSASRIVDGFPVNVPSKYRILDVLLSFAYFPSKTIFVCDFCKYFLSADLQTSLYPIKFGELEEFSRLKGFFLNFASF